MVNIVRHRSGTKVYSSEVELSANAQGAPTQYGHSYTLIPKDRIFSGTNKSGKFAKVQNSLFNLPFSDFYTQTAETSKGRKLRIEVHRWNDLKIRTKSGNNMKDKPLDLCCVRVFDTKTSEPVFDMVTEPAEVKNFGFPLTGVEKMKFLPKMAILLIGMVTELAEVKIRN